MVADPARRAGGRLAMRLLLEVGPTGEIYNDGEIYIDPELGAVDDPLADPAP